MADAAKPELTVGGVAMLTRVLAATDPAAPRIVVGPQRLRRLLPDDVTLTREDPPGGGPVAATAAGLAALPTGTGLVALLAADLPFLTAATVRSLGDAVEASGLDGAIVVDSADRPQWLCGVWRPDALRHRLAELG